MARRFYEDRTSIEDMNRTQKIITERGQVAVATVVFFLIISSTIIIGMSAPVYREVKNANEFVGSRESYYLSEGLNEDLVYRIKNGKAVSTSHTLSLNGYSATGIISTISGGKEIVTTGNRLNSLRRIRTSLSDNSVGVAFHYGVQVGEGGLEMNNTASIRGNVFSNGPITADDKNVVQGDVISSGPNGSINEITATSSAYAHTIANSNICGNAYYQSIDSSSLTFLNAPTSSKCGTPLTPGTAFPGSANQATSPMPISDAQITDWENAAAAGGVINSPCPYKITTDSVTLGPVKINCDLIIEKKNGTLNLTGPVWVSGNISAEDEAEIRIDASMGRFSVPLIADKISDRTNSSLIDMKNKSTFTGSGAAGSYVLMISMNRSAKDGGNVKAIETKNDASGKVVVYAPYGFIVVNKHATIKEVTGYKVQIKNDAQIIYETGIANLLFSAGPSGGYDIESWKEVE